MLRPSSDYAAGEMIALALHSRPRQTTRYSTGDRVGWSPAGSLEGGEGIVHAVLGKDSDEAEVWYEIAVYYENRFSGHLLPLPESVLYQIPHFDAGSQRLAPDDDAFTLPEGVVPLGESGCSLRYFTFDGRIEHVRICDAAGDQLAYYGMEAFEEDPLVTLARLLEDAQRFTRV
jgi:hypothetical protein